MCIPLVSLETGVFPIPGMLSEPSLSKLERVLKQAKSEILGKAFKGIADYGLETVQERFELAKLLCENDEADPVFHFLESFALSKDLRFTILKILIKFSPHYTDEIVKELNSYDELDRFEAAKVIASAYPNYVLYRTFSEDVPLIQMHRYEVVKVVLTLPDRSRILHDCSHLKLSEEQRFELLKIQIQRDAAWGYQLRLESYELSEELKYQLAKFAATCESIGFLANKFNLTSPKMIVEVVEICMSKDHFFREIDQDDCLSTGSSMVAKYVQRLPKEKDLYANLYEDAQKQDDLGLRTELTNWIDAQQGKYALIKKRIHLMCFADHKKIYSKEDDKENAELFATHVENELVHFRSLVEEIYYCRSPEDRKKMADLVGGLANFNKLGKYKRLLADPKARHSLIPTFLAFQIIQDSVSLKRFSARLVMARDFLRYGQNMRLLISFLLALKDAEIDPVYKHMILQQVFRDHEAEYQELVAPCKSELFRKSDTAKIALKQICHKEDSALAERLRLLSCFLACKATILVSPSYLSNDVLREKLQFLKEEMLGIKISDYGSTEAFNVLYKECIEDEFRDGDALFVYAGKINKLPVDEREVLFKAYTQFVNSLLAGSFHKIRQESPHLQEMWRRAPNPILAAHWARDHHCSLEEFLPAKSVSEVPFSERWRKFLSEKIHIDRHVANPESTLPHLWKIFQGERPAAVLKELFDSKEESTPHMELQKCCLQLCLLRTIDEGEVVLKNLKSILSTFSDSDWSQFKRDISELEKGIRSSKRGCCYSNWTIGITQDACDMLLLARETSGCQTIDGLPDLNKHALAYPIDGKNKALFIKGEDGRIKARSVIRLLWDEKNKIPALFMERFYASVFDARLFEALDRFAIHYAKHLGLSLYSGEIGRPIEAVSLHSFGSNAPFEYSDAAGGKTKGIFDISSAALIHRNV